MALKPSPTSLCLKLGQHLFFALGQNTQQNRHQRRPALAIQQRHLSTPPTRRERYGGLSQAHQTRLPGHTLELLTCNLSTLSSRRECKVTWTLHPVDMLLRPIRICVFSLRLVGLVSGLYIRSSVRGSA